MSRVVPIATVPNQEFSIQFENIRYRIRLRALVDMMSADIYIDEIPAVIGHRAVAGALLVPYRYLEVAGGNFVFLTFAGEFPYWEKFNLSQSLIYVTSKEMELRRAH